MSQSEEMRSTTTYLVGTGIGLSVIGGIIAVMASGLVGGWIAGGGAALFIAGILVDHQSGGG